jgi:hypothetical protein
MRAIVGYASPGGTTMYRMLLGITALMAAQLAFADNYTRPHVRKDGTYVPGHYSSESNNRRYDNYSGRGNVNPYTGERGSQRHEFTNPPAYNTNRQPRSDSYNNNPYSGRQPSRSRY